MIKSSEIKNLTIVKYILDNLKPINEYIDTLVEDSFEYENLCENVQEQLCEIEEALIGKEKYNMENIAKVDIRLMSYWNYLKEEIDFEELLEILKEHSEKLLLK